MEKRAAVPVGFPVPNPTEALWQTSPSPLAHYRATEHLPDRSATVIIGSGISGATIAWELLQRDAAHDLVMLEARTACSGATGRNGGHTKTASYRAFLSNKESLGENEAVKICRMQYATMTAVHQFARDHGIECDSWMGETVDIMNDSSQMEAAKRSIASLQAALGESDPAANYKIFNPEETTARFSTPDSYGSVSYEAGSISGYKFVMGVLQLAIGKGLKLYTETTATSLKYEGQAWLIETTRGAIRADCVILASNGYTAALYPALQGKIVPLRGEMTAQRRGDKMPPADPPRTYSFINHDSYEYMIQRPLRSDFGSDILIGGGLTAGPEGGLHEYGTVDDSTCDEAIMTYLADCTERYFKSHWGADHADGRIRAKWTGIMGYTPDGLPYVGPVPRETNLFISGAFQGLGMVTCLLCSRALVSMVHRTEEEDRLDDWFPTTFKLNEERMKLPFRGRLHTKPSRKD